jgi:hypothetical protein
MAALTGKTTEKVQPKRPENAKRAGNVAFPARVRVAD